ncbi:serine/threonine-protein kinase [Emticicia sp. SJ17W-69]|uniref:serine/threonine-protein kinase n=1 Tax=Emticicia sp. SJ17W-69 TaxID=3421657 RepID=UPI003EB6CF6F
MSITTFAEFYKRYPIKPNDDSYVLGSGTYGKVIKVEDQVETEWVAVKISEFKGNDTKSLKSEVEIAQKIPRQVNIARYDTCYRLETTTNICDFAIMKFYPEGNLLHLLKNTQLNNHQKEELIRGILLGLQHLHKHRIVHRDFKPANILISRDTSGKIIPKIADFGLSKLVQEEEIESSDFDLSDGRGTPSYKAPEQIEGGKVSFNLDIWAFGVILYEVFVGEKPFIINSKTGSDQSLKREIEHKIVTVEIPHKINNIPQPFQLMIRRCLVKDIHIRARKVEELLDILDGVAQLKQEAELLMATHKYEDAIFVYNDILKKREHDKKAIEGVKNCQKYIYEYTIQKLLSDANDFLNRKEYDIAEAKYNEVRILEPNNLIALDGIKKCENERLPQPKLSNEELTDIWEESTDIYIDSKPAIQQNTPIIPNSKKVLPNQKNANYNSNVVFSIIGLVALLSIGFYWSSNKSDSKTTQTEQSTTSLNPVLEVPNTNQLSSSSAIKTNKIIQPNTKKKNDNLPIPQEQIVTSLPIKPHVEINVSDNSALELQKLQEEYDILIDKGINAINNGNNKTLAINTFSLARQKADLNPKIKKNKAENAYNVYYSKGNRIFETDEYSGALSWFLVAQSLISTPDVSKKIKECNNNL